MPHTHYRTSRINDELRLTLVAYPAWEGMGMAVGLGSLAEVRTLVA